MPQKTQARKVNRHSTHNLDCLTKRSFCPIAAEPVQRAGVREFGFHALRRYVASVLADTHKVSAKTIQRILRHKNVTTTEKYIHNINNDMRSVMELFSDKGSHEGLPKKELEG
jgi:integrase